jgi:tetratricopeptide (TPR) repeat protein
MNQMQSLVHELKISIIDFQEALIEFESAYSLNSKNDGQTYLKNLPNIQTEMNVDEIVKVFDMMHIYAQLNTFCKKDSRYSVNISNIIEKLFYLIPSKTLFTSLFFHYQMDKKKPKFSKIIAINKFMLSVFSEQNIADQEDEFFSEKVFMLNIAYTYAQQGDYKNASFWFSKMNIGKNNNLILSLANLTEKLNAITDNEVSAKYHPEHIFDLKISNRDLCLS